MSFLLPNFAPTKTYTLSLHDALPILVRPRYRAERAVGERAVDRDGVLPDRREVAALPLRSEEHTSELHSPCNVVCRLLLEKKKRNRAEGGRSVCEEGNVWVRRLWRAG